MKATETIGAYGNTIKINPALYREAADYAAQQNINLTFYIETALENLLAQKKTPKNRQGRLASFCGILDGVFPKDMTDEEIRKEVYFEKFGTI